MSWIRNLHSNKALRLSARARKGKYIGPPMATKRMTCKQLQDKLYVGLYREELELNGHETELVSMCQPMKAIQALRARVGAERANLHDAKKLVDEVAARLGVLKRVMCSECNGQGSKLLYKGRTPLEELGGP